MSKLFWGLGLVVLAVLLVLDATGVLAPIFASVGGITAWQIIAGVAILAFLLSRLFKGNIVWIFIPLSLLFMVFEKNVAFMLGRAGEDIVSNWILLLASLLITMGMAILLPKRKWGFSFFSSDDDKNVGKSKTYYIDCNDFTSKNIENNMGSCTVRFENTSAYKGGGALHVENNMGSLVVNVPHEWHVSTNIENNMGSFDCRKHGDPDGPTIIVEGENNMGSLKINMV
ncbi:MAG: hypothetical protein ACI3XL_06150 [Eubacteriales bacterium]